LFNAKTLRTIYVLSEGLPENTWSVFVPNQDLAFVMGADPNLTTENTESTERVSFLFPPLWAQFFAGR